MNSLNQIILEGNVVRQPEMRGTASGFTVCSFPIAVNRKIKAQDGQFQDEVSYFDIDAFGQLAENCSKWAPKGRGVRVVGRLKQNRWKDDEGKVHSRIKVIAEHVEFKTFNKKHDDQDSANAGSNSSPQAGSHNSHHNEEVMDEVEF
ncbi:MAG: single-stranded DNA-binding protein [Treponema sp.]|nr:single-stranded DNA-binding protein [Treponema sp.]